MTTPDHVVALWEFAGDATLGQLSFPQSTLLRVNPCVAAPAGWAYGYCESGATGEGFFPLNYTEAYDAEKHKQVNPIDWSAPIDQPFQGSALEGLPVPPPPPEDPGYEEGSGCPQPGEGKEQTNYTDTQPSDDQNTSENQNYDYQPTSEYNEQSYEQSYSNQTTSEYTDTSFNQYDDYQQPDDAQNTDNWSTEGGGQDQIEQDAQLQPAHHAYQQQELLRMARSNPAGGQPTPGGSAPYGVAGRAFTRPNPPPHVVKGSTTPKFAPIASKPSPLSQSSPTTPTVPKPAPHPTISVVPPKPAPAMGPLMPKPAPIPTNPSPVSGRPLPVATPTTPTSNPPTPGGPPKPAPISGRPPLPPMTSNTTTNPSGQVNPARQPPIGGMNSKPAPGGVKPAPFSPSAFPSSGAPSNNNPTATTPKPGPVASNNPNGGFNSNTPSPTTPKPAPVNSGFPNTPSPSTPKPAPVNNIPSPTTPKPAPVNNYSPSGGFNGSLSGGSVSTRVKVSPRAGTQINNHHRVRPVSQFIVNTPPPGQPLIRGRPVGQSSPLPAGPSNGNQPPQQQPQQPQQPQVMYAEALYDYTGDATKNIFSFAKGTLIEVKAKNESGWWTGMLDGVLGYFPSNFVKEVEPQTKRRSLEFGNGVGGQLGGGTVPLGMEGTGRAFPAGGAAGPISPSRRQEEMNRRRSLGAPIPRNTLLSKSVGAPTPLTLTSDGPGGPAEGGAAGGGKKKKGLFSALKLKKKDKSSQAV